MISVIFIFPIFCFFGAVTATSYQIPGQPLSPTLLPVRIVQYVLYRNSVPSPPNRPPHSPVLMPSPSVSIASRIKFTAPPFRHLCLVHPIALGDQTLITIRYCRRL